MLHDPANDIQIQGQETVLHGLAIPVLGNCLVTLTILKNAILILEDAEETPEDVLGEDTLRVLSRVV
jgi:hypothetical protein